MRVVPTVAALAWIVGIAHSLIGAPTASASPACTPELQEDGSMIYALVHDAKPIKKRPNKKALLPKWIAGAKMYVTAEKGMTREYLHRAALCHASATDIPEYVHDPLRVDGEIKSIRVYSAGPSFVISVTSDEKATGREIWKRAEALTTEVDSLVKNEASQGTPEL
jgi:hypothetical protein